MHLLGITFPQTLVSNLLLHDISHWFLLHIHSFDEALLIKERGLFMARRKKTYPPTKEKRIIFRVTDNLYDVIAAEADKAKLSVSEYCRKVCTDKKIVIRQENVFDSQELLKALSDLGKIGGNLNQIAKHLNANGEFTPSIREDILQTITMLRDIRENIKEMAGEYRGNY